MSKSIIALNRFGFGFHGQQELPKQPQKWLLRQLQKNSLKPTALEDFPSSYELLKQRGGKGKMARKSMKKQAKKIFQAEALRTLQLRVETPHAFRERLVVFLANVLTVSIERKNCTAFVGPFEREVIRQNLHRGYGSMLVASSKHPAMLLYLDNVASVGPNSRRGRRKQKGRNENLAREILELHSVGMQAKYTQQDVIALANMLTGWTIPRNQRQFSRRSRSFHFAAAAHEPGNQRLLKHWFANTGVQQGEKALRMLAEQPYTAHHLARRMATHFVADQPPQPLVSAMTEAYLQGGDDIIAMARAMVLSPLAWSTELQKIKTPYEYMISVLRLLAPEEEMWQARFGKKILRELQFLGQYPKSASSPKGWSDQAEDWLGGESLLRRLRLAERVGKKFSSRVNNPVRLAEQAFGSMLSSNTRQQLMRAPNRQLSLALLLVSPEFQRR